MNPGADHSLRLIDKLTDISLGVIGAIIATIAGLGIRGIRNMLRDIERTKIRVAHLEKMLDMHAPDDGDDQ